MALLLLQAFPFAERIDDLDILSHALVEKTRIDVISPREKECKLFDFNAVDDHLRSVGRQVGLLLVLQTLEPSASALTWIIQSLDYLPVRRASSLESPIGNESSDDRQYAFKILLRRARRGDSGLRSSHFSGVA